MSVRHGVLRRNRLSRSRPTRCDRLEWPTRNYRLFKPSVQTHILIGEILPPDWLDFKASLEKRAKGWHYRTNRIFCVWHFQLKFEIIKTLVLNVHCVGWKILSTNQIAPFKSRIPAPKHWVYLVHRESNIYRPSESKTVVPYLIRSSRRNSSIFRAILGRAIPIINKVRIIIFLEILY